MSLRRVVTIFMSGLLALITFFVVIGSTVASEGNVVQLKVETADGLQTSRFHALSITRIPEALAESDNFFAKVASNFGFGLNDTVNFFKAPALMRTDTTTTDGATEVNVVAAARHYLATDLRPNSISNGNSYAEVYYELPDTAYEYQVLDYKHSGTSGTLAKVLAMYDTFSPFSAADKQIAVTGSMDAFLFSEVLPIRGLMAKADAAVAANMSMLIFPSDNCIIPRSDDVTRLLCGQTEYKGMRLAAVATVEEAVELLGGTVTDVLPPFNSMLLQAGNTVTVPVN